MPSWGLEDRGRDKISKYRTVSDKYYKGKEQIAIIGNLLVTVIKKGHCGWRWFAGKEWNEVKLRAGWAAP